MLVKIKDIFKRRLKKALNETNLISGNVKIGKNVYVSGCRLEGDISIAEQCKLYQCDINGNVNIQRFSSIWGPNVNIYGHVEIGSFCSIARNVSLQEYYHDFNRLTSYYIFKNLFDDAGVNENLTKGPITIGSDVWIGMHSCILSGVKIGDGAVIAANSVVNTDVPDFAIVAGSPAKIVDFRFSNEIIKELKKVRWWDWTMEEITKHKSLFSGDITLDKIHSIE
jgi:acetyltransferase-like isoleucine patch superfamily enzyme